MRAPALTRWEVAATPQGHAVLLRSVLRTIAVEPVDSYQDPAVYEAAQDLIEWLQDRLDMVTEEVAVHLVNRLEDVEPRDVEAVR